jgi:hypothetical protein
MFIVVYANSEEKRHQKKAKFAIRGAPGCSSLRILKKSFYFSLYQPAIRPPGAPASG